MTDGPKRRPTKKAFREFLNREYPEPDHREGRYHQRTRPYGDYLYAQDREKFDVEYTEWLAQQQAPSSVPE
jgi:hypothetical protein